MPLDAQLSLPESKFPYLLQDWDQELAVNEPYAKVNDVIRKIFGFDQSVNSLERTNRKMSESAEAYWEQLPAPASEEAGALVVVQPDGKGVVVNALANDVIFSLFTHLECPITIQLSFHRCSCEEYYSPKNSRMPSAKRRKSG